jgi:hypothetical protein
LKKELLHEFLVMRARCSPVCQLKLHGVTA